MQRSVLRNRLLAICTILLLVVAIVRFRSWYEAHLDRKLVYAIEIGDLATLRKLVAVGAHVNLQVKDRFSKPTPATYFKNALRGALRDPRKPKATPLMLAVTAGRLEIARLLLDHGATVDARDEYGFTPLTMAISTRHAAVVSLLLARGANPNAPNDLGMPPLLWALMLRQSGSACELLEHGANPNAYDSDHRSALYLAVLEEDAPAVQALLAHGADPNTSFQGYSALELAQAQHDEAIAQALVRKGAQGQASQAQKRSG